MKHVYPCIVCSIAVLLLCGVMSCKHTSVTRLPESPSAWKPLSDTLSLEQACKTLSLQLAAQSTGSDTIGQKQFYRMLDSTALYLRNSLGKRSGTPDGAREIISTIYRTWHISFTPNDTVFSTMLPQSVYGNRQGNCFGTGLLILLLAEQVHCPIYGVVLPGHFYCRYDNGKVTANIEPNKFGINHNDSYYRSRYLITDTTLYTLRNMTTKEVIGLLCYNAGTLCMTQSTIRTARALFHDALKRLPDYPEIQGNYALAYAKAGELDSSLMIFFPLFKKYPGMNNLAINYGLVAVYAHRYKLADSVFAVGLRYFPNNTTLLNGRAAAKKALLL